jgi:hypothetical protein
MNEWYDKMSAVLAEVKRNPRIHASLEVSALSEEDYDFVLNVHVYSGRKHRRLISLWVRSWYDGLDEDNRKAWKKIKRLVYGTK